MTGQWTILTKGTTTRSKSAPARLRTMPKWGDQRHDDMTHYGTRMVPMTDGFSSLGYDFRLLTFNKESLCCNHNRSKKALVVKSFIMWLVATFDL